MGGGAAVGAQAFLMSQNLKIVPILLLPLSRNCRPYVLYLLVYYAAKMYFRHPVACVLVAGVTNTLLCI